MLARLLNTPKDERFWELWGYDHQASHDAIREAIASRTNVQLSPQVIYPIPLGAMRNFLINNQQLHSDMNAVLGTLSQDLQDVDLRNPQQLDAWINLHWQEHNTVENALGIGT